MRKHLAYLLCLCLAFSKLSAQNATTSLTGTVTDEKGTPLAAVTVTALTNDKKVVTTAVTDVSGVFKINASPRVRTLQFSYIGLDEQVIPVSGNGKQWLTKYSAPSPYTDYVPVIRYSEVLLNLAEARTRSTSTVDPQAVALLSAVRSRSDATTTYTTASFASATALASAILEERNIEFLGEGLRNNDLMRLQLTVPAKGSAPAKNPGDQGYIWPISATELALNPLCTDN